MQVLYVKNIISLYWRYRNFVQRCKNFIHKSIIILYKLLKQIQLMWSDQQL